MCESRRSTRVVEDHPEHVPAPAVNGADAVAHLHAVVAAGGAAGAVVFPVHHRPRRGTRGDHRVQVRHGVSAVHSGSRHVLGVIFHNAR